MKKTLLFTGTLFFIASSTTVLKAQMVGTDAYIKGTSVEVGIDGAGGYEGANTTVSAPPAGMHFRSGTSYFGFVANPQLDGWVNYDGDFFTPGSPENGWGLEVGGATGIVANNNCAGIPQTEIPGTITSWTHIGTNYSTNWEGDMTTGGTNLHIKINYLLEETSLFYITTVSITNNTTSTIPDMYYHRNVDPDNNEMLSSDFTTQNTIVSQTTTTSLAQVSATATTPWNSYFSLAALDSSADWKAGYGGFSNRDASDMWNGIGFTETPASTVFADAAIYLANRIQNLTPGATQTFKFATIFGASGVQCAINALAISFAPIPYVCDNAPAFPLSGGSPAGGVYSGAGVVGGTTFDPSLVGGGAHTILYTVTDTTGCSSFASAVVDVDFCTGVKNKELSNSVSVYPNPVNELATFTINSAVPVKDASIFITDVLGKEVMKASNIQSHEIIIDRNNLSGGIYFYKVMNNGASIGSGKLIIK
jgi:hypothetical protein